MKQPTLDNLSAEYVRSRLRYDPGAGEFFWRQDPTKSVQWNARYAGKRAGYLRPPRGIRVISIMGLNYQGHRLAWLYVHGKWPPDEVDHIDGNPSNNAIANLRPATKMQNQHNAKLRSDSRTGFKGVQWHKASGRYRARIRVNGERHELGGFDTAEEAAAARSAMAAELHGEFARSQ